MCGAASVFFFFYYYLFIDISDTAFVYYWFCLRLNVNEKNTYFFKTLNFLSI